VSFADRKGEIGRWPGRWHVKAQRGREGANRRRAAEGHEGRRRTPERDRSLGSARSKASARGADGAVIGLRSDAFDSNGICRRQRREERQPSEKPWTGGSDEGVDQRADGGEARRAVELVDQPSSPAGGRTRALPGRAVEETSRRLARVQGLAEAAGKIGDVVKPDQRYCRSGPNSWR